jgi:large subunit ribosomal protein L16
MKRSGRVWIRVFPDKPVTLRPPETTMGGGKGSVDHYVFPVRPGRVLFEVDGVPEETAREALRLASFKLPVKTRVIKK